MVEAGLLTGSRFGPEAMRNIWRTMHAAAIRALPIPEAGAGECDGSCGMLDCHSHDDEHPYEADGYLTIDHGPPEKPAPQPQQAVEAVEAMRRACIAAVRAEQRYEGSDFPVCNAIVREIEAIPALPAPKVEGQG